MSSTKFMNLLGQINFHNFFISTFYMLNKLIIYLFMDFGVIE